jgi:hypothetical protein
MRLVQALLPRLGWRNLLDSFLMMTLPKELKFSATTTNAPSPSKKIADLALGHHLQSCHGFKEAVAEGVS